MAFKLKRKIEEKIYYWHENDSRSALLITGAKQIGKTFTIRDFLKNIQVIIVKLISLKY